MQPSPTTMAVSALSFVVFLALIGYTNAAYCLCNTALNNSVLQKNIDFACKNGAECARIHPKGACFSPNTVKDHCNYAVNSYYQIKNEVPGSCDFSGTVSLYQQAPPGSNPACYPDS